MIDKLINIPVLVNSAVIAISVVTLGVVVINIHNRRKKRKESNEISVIKLMDLVPLWADANKHVIAVEAEVKQSSDTGDLPPAEKNSAVAAENTVDSSNKTQKTQDKPLVPETVNNPDDLPTVVIQPLKDDSVAKDSELPQTIEAPAADSLQARVEQLIEPYSNIVNASGARKAINALIELLTTDGSLPSVVERKVKEAGFAKALTGLQPSTANHIHSALKKISLADHSVNTLRFLLQELRKYSQDYKPFVPGGVVAALGHDIGKIYYHKNDQSRIYNKYDHAIVGCQVVSEMIPENYPWKEAALSAIESHHQNSQEPLSVCLQKADGEARNLELTQVADVSSTDAVTWLTEARIPDVLTALGQQVNILPQHFRRPQIFSFGTYVYCPVSDFLKIIRNVMWRDKGFDIRLYISSLSCERMMQNLLIPKFSKSLDSPTPVPYKVTTNFASGIYPPLLLFKVSTLGASTGELEKRLHDTGFIIKAVMPLEREKKNV